MDKNRIEEIREKCKTLDFIDVNSACRTMLKLLDALEAEMARADEAAIDLTVWKDKDNSAKLIIALQKAGDELSARYDTLKKERDELKALVAAMEYAIKTEYGLCKVCVNFERPRCDNPCSGCVESKYHSLWQFDVELFSGGEGE